MIFGRHGHKRLKAALFAVAALALSAAALGQASGNDVVDPSTTGSIKPADAPVSQPVSPEFRAGLQTLAAGRGQEAYAIAAALGNEAERRTLQWAAISFDGADLDIGSIERFAADAGQFGSASLFKTRIEQSLVKAKPAPEEVIRQLGGSVPNTLDGQIALATAYFQAGNAERAAPIVRDLWKSQFLDRPTEDKVLAQLGTLLDRDTHWARAVHLMMQDRAASVERLLPFLSPAQKSLAVARIAVARRAASAKTLLDKVDPSLTSHPVYLFSRAQRARQAGLYESALDWLNKAHGKLPDAEEWWYERRTLIRSILGAGDARLAYKAASTYKDGPEGRLVEARFHSGWIALAFLNDAAAAKPHFEAMRGIATLPDSVAQANYWLGRSLRKLGDTEGAKAAFDRAAKYGTVYYGLLARAELGLKGAPLRSMPAPQGREAAFQANQVVQGVRLLARNGHPDWAATLLRSFAGQLQDGGDLLLAARLAQEIGAQHVAILIADIADQRGTPLDLFSFPKDGIPADTQLAAIDKAAIFAITRQESSFKVDAMSVVGARGLMQLMPATAKEIATKLGLEFSASRLTSDPAYNALLGSTYLAKQLDHYDGSLLLAAAAYNSGAGNANKWISAYGDPRAGNVDPVVWVELIPFQETRKYVQRVLGNYLVYRTRLGDQSMTIAEALRKIP